VIVLTGGEFEYCRDVFGFEIGIVGQDLFPRRTGGLVTSPRPSSRYAVAATP